MTTHEILLHHLVGRMVHDVNGERVGRIHELCAEIELHEHGNDYVVREFHLGVLGWMEALVGRRLAQMAARALRGRADEPLIVSWERMDLTDPLHPRLTVPKSSLNATQLRTT